MTSELDDKPVKLCNRLGWGAFVALACAHFTILCYWRSPEFLNLPLYAQYGERLPYQGRILMAWWLRLTAANARVGPVLAKLAHVLPPQLQDPYALALMVSTFVAMVVAVVATRATVLHLTGARKFASWAALLTLYMAYFNLLAVYGLVYVLPYDAPALALFCVAVWMVLTRRLGWLLPVFVVGTLNRETFCFVTIFMVLYAWFGASGKGRVEALKRVAPHMVLQAAAWVAIRLWLHHKFLGNPQDIASGNGFFAFQLLRNLKYLTRPAQWPLALALFGFTLPLFFGSYKWIGDKGLARATVVVMGLWLTAMLVVGIIIEVRVFDELTAMLAPCVALIVWNRWLRAPVGHEQS